MTAARYGITMTMLGPLEMSISFLSTMNDTQTEVACLLQVASNQSAIYIATSASFLLALFAADFPVRAAKSVLECRKYQYRSWDAVPCSPWLLKPELGRQQSSLCLKLHTEDPRS